MTKYRGRNPKSKSSAIWQIMINKYIAIICSSFSKEKDSLPIKRLNALQYVPVPVFVQFIVSAATLATRAADYVPAQEKKAIDGIITRKCRPDA